MRKKSVLASSLQSQSRILSLELSTNAHRVGALRRFRRFLRGLGRFRAWLSHGSNQLGQSDEVVGSGRQREHPADTGNAAVTGFAEAGSRLGPAKHLLNALAHPPTDHIAGMAGC